jgi:hypothetical protein
MASAAEQTKQHSSNRAHTACSVVGTAAASVASLDAANNTSTTAPPPSLLVQVLHMERSVDSLLNLHCHLCLLFPFDYYLASSRLQVFSNMERSVDTVRTACST